MTKAHAKRGGSRGRSAPGPVSKRFENENWSGAVMRDIDLSNAKIVGALMTNASFSGEIGGLKINEIEVAPLIARELERRYPERKEIFAADPEGMRKAFDIVFGLLDRTWERARRLSEEQRYQRVDEEWSVVETVRHLVFAVDAWIGRAVLGRDDPFDPIALPPTFLPPSAPGMTCDPDARPSFEEALKVWKEREAEIRDIVNELTPGELERPITTKGDGYPPAGHQTQVIGPLWTIIEESWWHNFFMNRDMDAIDATSS
jgi:hypothetical protein